MPPDVVTFNTWLRGLCAKGENINEAVGFFHGIVHNDCPVNAVTLNTLVKALVQTGQVNHAVLLLPEMNNFGTRDNDFQPDVVALNTVVYGLSKNGLAKEALEQFQVMKINKVMTDAFTYNTLIWCRK